MKKMLAYGLGICLMLWLVGCTTQTTTEAVRATAEVIGCWPYQYRQPATPTPVGDLEQPTEGIVYPTCVPEDGEPTHTPVPPPRATRHPPASLGSVIEIAQMAGKSTNHVLAAHPHQDTVLVGWTSWGWSHQAGQDGAVGVRAQQASGYWGDVWTLNPHSLTVNAGVGGIGMTILPSGTMVVAFGDGRGALFLVESHDSGATWTDPVSLGAVAYQVLDLVHDAAGGLHLLALTPNPHQLRYLYRAPQQTTWDAPNAIAGGEHYKADFALLMTPDGVVHRFVVWTDHRQRIQVARSNDGQTWHVSPLDMNRYMRERQPDFPTITAFWRGSEAIVAVAWSQYSAGGIFAQVSRDAGHTWGLSEQVVQHQEDGACYDHAGRGLRCGYEPALVYDAALDQLALSFVEIERQRVPPQRLLLVSRSLVSDQEPWRFGITPQTRDTAQPPVLMGWGWRGYLWGTSDGHRHWVVAVEQKNNQYHLIVRPVVLSWLFAEGVS